MSVASKLLNCLLAVFVSCHVVAGLEATEATSAPDLKGVIKAADEANEATDAISVAVQSLTDAAKLAHKTVQALTHEDILKALKQAISREPGDDEGARLATIQALRKRLESELTPNADKMITDQVQKDLQDAAHELRQAWKKQQSALENAMKALLEAFPSPTVENGTETNAEPAADDAAKTPSEFSFVDAFSRLPLVQDMEAAESLKDFLVCESEDEQGNECNPRIYLCDHRFDAPAHFPLRKFGINGENIDDEGAIIYEGMRFAVQPDGRYQVRFVAGTPAMPVTFRLQLILANDGDGNRYTLTLPPISIPKKVEPRHTSQDVFIDQVYAGTQTVHHEGYLPLLAQANLGKIRVIRRQGTARFGFGIDVP